VDERGNPYPKANFLTAGPWLAGATRVERKFPGLLAPHKKALMDKHLAKKRRDKLVDTAANEAIDDALESWIRERGLWHEYESDCREYVRRKTKAQKEEPLKRLMQAALGHHSRTGIWPLAYSAMSLVMWRMLPRELRSAITLAIRVHQVIRKPRKAIRLVTTAVLNREPTMRGPV